MKQLQNATFEDITEVDVTAPAAAAAAAALARESGVVVPTVSTLQRRRISNTFTKFPNAKRKRVDDIVEVEDDIDDPEADLIATVDEEDDIVMFDPNESIIEGPDDEEDDL